MYFNLIKSLIIASFIFFNSVIFAQDFGLTPKLIKNIEGSYTAYTSVSLNGFFSLLDNKLEFGPTFGISYSEPKVDLNSTVPDYYYVDVIDIAKASFGFDLYYNANFVDSKYVPFLGLKVKNYFDAKSFLFFLKSGANNIMEPGLYSFHSKDDYEVSLSTGIKIVTKDSFNILFELEYQHREFTLNYDEYEDNPEGWLDLINEHSDKKIINAFNFGIGLQFIF